MEILGKLLHICGVPAKGSRAGTQAELCSSPQQHSGGALVKVHTFSRGCFSVKIK